jgi:glycosyltransferase involved in cell wall biosynthesis
VTTPRRQPTLCYVVPVHNQEGVLATSVETMVERLSRHPGSEVILVENGSTDGSADLVERQARLYEAGPVRVVASTSEKGLGCAWRRGMELAAADLIVLTAADLPFGFTDLDATLALDPRPALVLGSKAHPMSQVSRTMSRRIMSLGFRGLRMALLGMTVGDSQGTLLMTRELARATLPDLRSPDFFIGTEIAAVAAARGVGSVEVPIRLLRRDARSTVSPVRDSLRMALETWRLRARLRRAARAADDDVSLRPRLSPTAAGIRSLIVRWTGSAALADLVTFLVAISGLAAGLVGLVGVLALVGLSAHELSVLVPGLTGRAVRLTALAWALGVSPLVLGALIGYAAGPRRRGTQG